MAHAANGIGRMSEERQRGLALPSSIPIDVARAFRSLHQYVGELHSLVQAQQEKIDSRVGTDPQSLLQVARFVRNELQATGKYPLTVAQLPGAGGTATKTSMAASVGASTPVATGDLSESVSDVLTITGGSGAVVGDGVQIQVNRASDTQDGYLTSTDYHRFGSGTRMIVDIHGNRTPANYDPATLSTGTGYFETDRHSLYMVVAGAWTWVSGLMTGPSASKPSDLGAADSGFTYLDTTTQELSTWLGVSWTVITAVWE